MPEVKPVMELVKVPVPVPVVTLNVEDPALVPQTKPLAVILAPPSDVISPPLIAELVVIE